MDDTYAISAAKTHFQEAWNSGDLPRLMSVICERLVDFTEGGPSFFGPEGRLSLQQRFERMHEQYQVRLNVIMIRILVSGDMAVDMGWEEWRLVPKDGGPAVNRRKRYLETWRREADGQWRIAAFINNQDSPPEMLAAT